MEARRFTLAIFYYVQKQPILTQVVLVNISIDFSSSPIRPNVISFTRGRFLVDLLNSAVNHVTFTPKHGYVTQCHALIWSI